MLSFILMVKEEKNIKKTQTLEYAIARVRREQELVERGEIGKMREREITQDYAKKV